MSNTSIVKVPLSDYVQFDDFMVRSKYLYKIRPESGGNPIPYQFNQPQKKLDDIIKEEFALSQAQFGVNKARLIILKARQLGFTTDTAVRNFDSMLQYNLAQGLVLAHDDDSTPLIWKKYEMLYKELPDVIEITDDETGKVLGSVNVKPTTINDSGTRLRFADMTQSEVYIRTAGAGQRVGRGDTINFSHLSEAGFYSKYSENKNAINQQMPKDAYNYYVIESTANGMNGIGEGFYNDWTENVKEYERYKKGEITDFIGFRPVFMSWYEIDKYSLPLKNGQMYDIESINFEPITKKEFLEKEEMLHEEMGVSLEQLNWYRWCLIQNCDRKLINAYREYPTFPIEAFQATSSCFFNTNKLFTVLNTYKQEGAPEFIQGGIDNDIQFYEDPFGNLKIFEQPEIGWYNRYFIGVDISKGKEDGDYTVMMVYDKLNERFVAYWRGIMDEYLIAEEVCKLGYYYNYADIIPESNLATVVNTIRPGGLMEYEGRLYIRSYTANGIPSYGYDTNAGTRMPLLNEYKEYLESDENRYYNLYDETIINEHLTFVRKISGNKTKYEAQDSKTHDDIIIASALAVHGANNLEEELLPYNVNDDSEDILVDLTRIKRSTRRKTIKHWQVGRKKT